MTEAANSSMPALRQILERARTVLPDAARAAASTVMERFFGAEDQSSVSAVERERDTLVKYYAGRDPEEFVARRRSRGHSIDGIPTRPTDRYFAGD